MPSILPRSLLARNIVPLVALLAFSQACSLAVLLRFVQRPRLERAADIFAGYVETLDAMLAAMPAGAAAATAAGLGAQPQAPPAAAPQPTPSPLRLLRDYQRDVFLDVLQRRLPPELLVRWQDNGDERVWIRLRHAGPAGAPAWLPLPVIEDARAGGLTATVLMSAVLALLAALTGYWLQRHINRPLQELAHAARLLSAGQAPVALPTDGPTEIAQVSTAFNQMTQALQQAEATRSLMLAGISHDIRTPLTKLRLAMAMAIPRGADDSFVAAVEGYLDQIDTILQQFMDYAGSGEREPPETGDLNALVGRLAADFAGLGHEFELSLGALPPLPFRPVSLMRLLMNLMQNAIVYGKHGLAVRTWREGDRACIAICDRGSGLSAPELEALKAPFSRGRNAQGHAGGTGLGLAIVERIARLHGGTLHFRPRAGGGLEAVVALPLHASAA
ncbi:ATP-binding protein [Cupriavidus malaysiensis]|nr:ATP-binding protein [Cupriavidus malaysiensis]